MDNNQKEEIKNSIHKSLSSKFLKKSNINSRKGIISVDISNINFNPNNKYYF